MDCVWQTMFRMNDWPAWGMDRPQMKWRRTHKMFHRRMYWRVRCRWQPPLYYWPV